jgi:hypothetical protein
MKIAIRIVTTLALAVAFGCQVKARGGSTPGDEGPKIAAVARDANSPTGPAAGASVTNGRNAAQDCNGPTALLSYTRETFKTNPIWSFMYFIPLISPVPVDRKTSADNEQHVGIISYERKVTARSFYVTCEFEIQGSGFNRYVFDPTGMMETYSARMEKGETLTNMLDYIDFKGEGFGGIQIKGIIADSTETVTEVDLQFNARGRKSPVTIGLYEIKPRNGQYCYERRSNEIVARINTLTFKKGKEPRMGITVASVTKKADGDGLLGRFKAAVTNLFIKPVKVDPLGNEALLRFGYALLKQQPAFTFPKAPNLKEVQIVAADPKSE